MQRLSLQSWRLFITVTLVPEDRATASKKWTVLARWLRRQGVTSYARALEVGDTHGMRHWHVLTSGVDRVPIEALNAETAKLGLGHCWIEKVQPDERPELYLSKYLTKGSGTYAHKTIGWRLITVSRDQPPWFVTAAYLYGIPRPDPSGFWVVRGSSGVPVAAPRPVMEGRRIGRIANWLDYLDNLERRSKLPSNAIANWARVAFARRRVPT